MEATTVTVNIGEEYSPGDQVQYYDDGWRTGKYVKTVEKGRKFGLLEIHKLIPGYEEKVFIEPELVKPLPELEKMESAAKRIRSFVSKKKVKRS